MILLTALLGCQDYDLSDPPLPSVATPPGTTGTNTGEPPDWNNCFEGFLGEYSNLAVTHPDVEPATRDGLFPDPTALDWWDEPVYQEFSSSLDFGSNWWPVDEGLAGDPAYFSVRWSAWLRAWDDTTMTFTLGSADDVWIILDNDVIFADSGIKDFEPTTYSLDLDAGQYPIEIRFAHRSGESGFRFRKLTGDVSLCYAEYDDDDDDEPAEE